MAGATRTLHHKIAILQVQKHMFDAPVSLLNNLQYNNAVAWRDVANLPHSVVRGRQRLRRSVGQGSFEARPPAHKSGRPTEVLVLRGPGNNNLLPSGGRHYN